MSARAIVVGVVVAALLAAGCTDKEAERAASREWRAAKQAKAAQRISEGPKVISTAQIENGKVQVVAVPLPGEMDTIHYVQHCVLFTADSGAVAISCESPALDL